MHKKEIFPDDIKDIISNTIDKKGRLYFEVENANLHKVVDYLFNKLDCRLSTATCMEMYRGIEILYHFSNDITGQYYCPRLVITDLEKPTAKSITPIVKGAEWIEREMSEYWGVTFEGHPRPEALLTKDNPKGEGLGQPFRIRRLS